jgi:HK97 family phage major capsid protein
MAEAFESKQAEFKNFAKDRNAKLVLDLKDVGTMTTTANLTGDGQATYNTRQGLVPSQKINFRDLIPTTQSPTGLYVTYRETGTEGAITVQTEGNAKGQIDYDLTEVKVVSDYIAGFARFSKQMMFQLPFLQSSLQRMLLRDFYKKENAQFFSVVSGAATGSTTTSATVDAEQLVDYIANQLNANFNASFVLVNYSQWARLLKTKPSDYSVPGGVIIDPNGNIRICGVPVIGASWVTDDKALIIDSDFVERVETESLRVEFSYEDSDNFQRNLVTARVECFEDINVMRTDALIYADFGNVS